MNSLIILLTIFGLTLNNVVVSQRRGEGEYMLAVMKDFMLELVGRTGTTRGIKRAAAVHRIQAPVGQAIPFPCNTNNTRSVTRPTNVNQVRPGDIDVIAAMGDSLTAGNGAAASSIFHISTENRGISWSIGGQGTWRDYLTLPNILKEFNPNLIGYSRNDSHTHHKESQFNVAEIGAMSRDMPYMAKVLVKRIRADKRVDFENDWKMVTLMVGPNDMCVDVCYHSEKYMLDAPENHKQDLMKALDYLRDNLPRTIVNLVTSPSMAVIKNFNDKPGLCRWMHVMECPCWFGNGMKHRRKMIYQVQDEWQKVEEAVASDMRYRNNSNFAVVLQPFIDDLIFPIIEKSGQKVTDYTYLSADCFHLSQKGYARAANVLWNNILQRAGEKSRNWEETFDKFLCPNDDNPYIYTYDNSHVVNKNETDSVR